MITARIAPLTYTPGNLEYFSFIRGGIGADCHQEPRFYQFPDGDLMMYWSAYDYDECSPNMVKLFSISKDRGLTWSNPQVYMADFPGGVLYFVFLLRLHATEQALMVLARTRHHIKVDEERRTRVAGSNYFTAQTRLFIRHSSDGGRTFEHGHELPYTDVSGGKVLPGIGFYGGVNELLQLRSGRVVASFSYMDPARSDGEKGVQHYSATCMLSDDGGNAWRRSSEIIADTPRGVMETQIVETAPDRLFCLFRTKGGYLYETESEDGGETWSASKPSSLPSCEAMARMIRLISGNLLVVWNNVSSTTQKPRYPLVAAVSCDGGRTWSEPRVIATESGANQLSNHGLIQLDDGRILLGISNYIDKRPVISNLDMAIFDEEWLNS